MLPIPLRWHPLASSLELAPVGDGLVVFTSIARAYEMEGSWFTPTSCRADLMLFKLRP